MPGNRNSKYHGPVQVCLRVFEELKGARVAGAGDAGERRGEGMRCQFDRILQAYTKSFRPSEMGAMGGFWAEEG